MDDRKLIKKILEQTKTIAVVGLSPKPHRTSHSVSKNIQGKGYRIIPVYPREETILNEKVYRSVSEIKEPIDLVVIFRKSEEVYPVVEDAVKVKPKAIWMQQGIVNEEAAALARDAGIDVVMDRCISLEYSYFSAGHYDG